MLNLKEKAQIGKGTNIFNIWFKLFRKGAIQSGAPLPGLQKFRQEINYYGISLYVFLISDLAYQIRNKSCRKYEIMSMYPPDGKEEICLKIKERRENILLRRTDTKSRKDFVREEPLRRLH